ncbi:MAG TPA: deoxyribonuclease V [Gammaproteobacteria bacterium]
MGKLHLHHEHRWDITPKEAVALQRRMCALVERCDRLGEVHLVAGVDVGYEANNTITRAAVAVLRFPELTVESYAIARLPTTFPYVPGLLSFREIPAVLQALEQLPRLPDLLLCDGQGIAHPRRFGIAAHLGVLTDLPAIGVAKSRLIGAHGELPQEKGRWVPLCDHEEVVGAVVRSRNGVSPLYVSLGHRVSLATAIHYVLACTTRYRLPETTRWAHRLASGPEPEVAL